MYWMYDLVLLLMLMESEIRRISTKKISRDKQKFEKLSSKKHIRSMIKEVNQSSFPICEQFKKTKPARWINNQVPAQVFAIASRNGIVEFRLTPDEGAS